MFNWGRMVQKFQCSSCLLFRKQGMLVKVLNNSSKLTGASKHAVVKLCGSETAMNTWKRDIHNK